jgi:hypothetical protein
MYEYDVSSDFSEMTVTTPKSPHLDNLENDKAFNVITRLTDILSKNCDKPPEPSESHIKSDNFKNRNFQDTTHKTISKHPSWQTHNKEIKQVIQQSMKNIITTSKKYDGDTQHPGKVIPPSNYGNGVVSPNYGNTTKTQPAFLSNSSPLYNKIWLNNKQTITKYPDNRHTNNKFEKIDNRVTSSKTVVTNLKPSSSTHTYVNNSYTESDSSKHSLSQGSSNIIKIIPTDKDRSKPHGKETTKTGKNNFSNENGNIVNKKVGTKPKARVGFCKKEPTNHEHVSKKVSLSSKEFGIDKKQFPHNEQITDKNVFPLTESCKNKKQFPNTDPVVDNISVSSDGFGKKHLPNNQGVAAKTLVPLPEASRNKKQVSNKEFNIENDIKEITPIVDKTHAIAINEIAANPEDFIVNNNKETVSDKETVSIANNFDAALEDKPTDQIVTINTKEVDVVVNDIGKIETKGITINNFLTSVNEITIDKQIVPQEHDLVCELENNKELVSNADEAVVQNNITLTEPNKDYTLSDSTKGPTCTFLTDGDVEKIDHVNILSNTDILAETLNESTVLDFVHCENLELQKKETHISNDNLVETDEIKQKSNDTTCAKLDEVNQQPLVNDDNEEYSNNVASEIKLFKSSANTEDFNNLSIKYANGNNQINENCKIAVVTNDYRVKPDDQYIIIDSTLPRVVILNVLETSASISKALHIKSVSKGPHKIVVNNKNNNINKKHQYLILIENRSITLIPYGLTWYTF